MENALTDRMQDVISKLVKVQELEMRATKVSASDAEVIKTLRKGIPDPILAHYDRLRIRGKKGVAIIRNQVCTSCHMGVAIGTIVTLKQGKDIQLCGSCGRYLHLPPELESETAVAMLPAKPKRKKRAAVRVPDAS
jgi:predicted  nucleic acid-binding Zn-ribbon protein